MKRILGYDPEDLPGEAVVQFIHPDDRPLVRTTARDLAAGRPLSGLEVRIRRDDGGWVPIGWSLALGPEGHVYGVGRDQTESVRNREARLRQEVAELRLRTALELHDGILQTLTGAGFQIAAARRLLRTDPEAAERVLAALAESLAAEQQELRLYVDEIKSRTPEWHGGGPGLEARFDAMLKRVSLIWGLSTDADVRLPDDLSPETQRRLLRIVQEAAVNAVRHGGARSVSLTGVMSEREVLLEISDDGHGFSFRGDFDDAALKSRRLGPVSLKHRVAAAGGKISIRSTPRGSRISVRIPLEGSP